MHQLALIVGDAQPDTWLTVALAALNVLQTVALAYLAAAKYSSSKP